MDNHPVPDEFANYGSFHQLDELNNQRLKELFEETAANPAGSKEKELMASFYLSGMDTSAIEAQGISPLLPLLGEINAIKDKEGLIEIISKLHTLQVYPLFYFYSAQDERNSRIEIAQLMQGGLGLPDRDYYLTEGQPYENIRAEYMKYLEKVFALRGENEATAAESAKIVFGIEKRLAKASMTMLERRDPIAQYNKKTTEELKKEIPGFNWDLFFAKTGAGNPAVVNINQPLFFAEVGKMIQEIPVGNWKVYLSFHTLNSFAPYLSSGIVNAQFAFYGTTLSGKVKLRERHKRVIEAANNMLGECVGKFYVEKYFPETSKQRMTELVISLKESWAAHIQSLDWMSAETRNKALQKLDSMKFKIGYPDKWIDYSSLQMQKDNFVANVMEARRFEFVRGIKEINQPVDRQKWEMSPQTVNAYFHPNLNEIVFPAAILQPPFFFPDADDAVNYGAIGAIIGHEMTHGFDDQGRLYDAEGNLNDWWSEEDSKKFNEKTKPLIQFYSNYQVADALFVDGELTLGENIADLGGVSVSLDALKKKLTGSEPAIDGFSPVQRFFLAYAQVWRQNIRPEELQKRVKTDVHSPAQARVNGIVYQHPDFYSHFNVTAGNKRYIAEKERIVIW
jgi:putative endopeptidase